MRVRTLGSGSTGNSAVVQSDELRVLIDAGLTAPELERRLELVQVPPLGLDHVLVTHGHLDHARAAGQLARRHHALLHAAPAILPHSSLRRAKRSAELSPSRDTVLDAPGRCTSPIAVRARTVSHDADPTFALGLTCGDRRLAVITDAGRADSEVTAEFANSSVLILEFNHDPELLEAGPYPGSLQRRVAGDRGHLSNAQAAEWLGELCGPRLHTLVLAHLSAKNNTEQLARAAADERLAQLGRTDVRVLVASPTEPGPWIDV